jgi:hypothetical protein
MTILNSPDFLIRNFVQKAAADHGFRLERGEKNGWLGYGSTTAPGQIWIASTPARDAWFLSLDHPGVVSELSNIPRATTQGPGLATFVCPELASLHRVVSRVYTLARSLPDAPLARFEAMLQKLPPSTKVERMVVQRIGQEVFREALMDYWGKRCPITGITDPALLRASHIVAWAECESDAQRLDVHNGLLLSALWDAAFDTGLVSFADDGNALASPNLSEEAKGALGFGNNTCISNLRPEHRVNFARHRMRHGY